MAHEARIAIGIGIQAKRSVVTFRLIILIFAVLELWIIQY